MKICIYDMKNDGHHFFYNKNVMKVEGEWIYFTGTVNEVEKEELIKENIRIIEKKFKDTNKYIRYFYEIYNLFGVLKYCKKNKVSKLIIACLDSNIIWLYLWLKLFRKIEIIGVEHWYPNNKIKKKYFKKLCDRIKIIVHTEDIYQKIGLINNKNIFVVKYPVMGCEIIDKRKAKEYLDIKEEIFELLYFGGTRDDKGLDILLEAVQKVKKDIMVVIAGKEETFKREFIVEKLKKASRVSYKLELKFIADSDIKYYFNSCEIVIIPYKKYFNGESGVFTEAINYGRPVIVPNIIHFPKIVKENEIGEVFEVEDSMDLCEKIENMIEKYKFYEKQAIKFSKEYQEAHSIKRFCENYKKIIEE